MAGTGWRSEKLRRRREVVAPAVRLLTEQLSAANPGLEFHISGSWRRGAQVVGDLDILVVTDSPILPNLFDSGVMLPPAVTWQRLGPRIANGDLRLKDGPLHVDVWQAPARSRGAMLLFTTGPAALNTFQRSRAKRLGMSLSQDALADRRTGRQLDDGTEESVFRLLDLPYLSPQERQRWATRH